MSTEQGNAMACRAVACAQVEFKTRGDIWPRRIPSKVMATVHYRRRVKRPCSAQLALAMTTLRLGHHGTGQAAIPCCARLVVQVCSPVRELFRTCERRM
jgi:hypothetical protein